MRGAASGRFASAEVRSHAQKLDDAIRFSGHQRQWAIVVTNEQGTVVCEIRRETTASAALDDKVVDLIDREELWKHRRPKARSWVRRRDRVDEEREGEPRSDTKDKN